MKPRTFISSWTNSTTSNSSAISHFYQSLGRRINDSMVNYSLYGDRLSDLAFDGSAEQHYAAG
ncbi:MAG TPA: hypothetical protein DC039_00120 [Leclercia adecarboxylata]|jgi:hypothetical protein|nr:hypothetical protein [Leclercia adecarboxylata]